MIMNVFSTMFEDYCDEKEATDDKGEFVNEMKVS